MHLLAKTLLDVETLDLEQIKNLIEKGNIEEGSEGGSSEGGEESKAEPIIDTLGNVRVRIQTRDDEPLPTTPDTKPSDSGSEEPK
jgi:cell division protease FtsH